MINSAITANNFTKFEEVTKGQNCKGSHTSFATYRK